MNVSRLANIRGALIDVDGVLHVDGEPIPGAADALDHLRRANIPFILLTNTTMRTRAALGALLRGRGFDVADDEIVTAAAATADHLRRHHPGEICYLIVSGDVTGEFNDIPQTDGLNADLVVMGGAGDAYTYRALNHAYRLLRQGAGLIAMHKNISWMTADGIALDSGPFIHGLEWATGVQSTIIGKPSRPFFDAGYHALDLPPEQVVMISDNNAQDLRPAKSFGGASILVRTGSFEERDLDDGEVDLVLDSIADLSDALAHLLPG